MRGDAFFAGLIADDLELQKLATKTDPQFFLAANVYDLRARRRMTQAALADAAGVAETRIAQIEGGDANPRLRTMTRLAHALGVTVTDLLQPPPGHEARYSPAAAAEDQVPVSEEEPARRRKAG